MKDLRQRTEERIGVWEKRLRDEVEVSQLEEERHRIERELAELSQARDDLGSMGEEELRRLHDRLTTEPAEWLAHSA